MGSWIRWVVLWVFGVLSLDVQAGVASTSPAGLSASEWTDIRSQIEAPKYQVRETSAGFEAHNPRQGWKILYRPDGQTRIEPRDAGVKAYRIGLKLAAIGYGDRLTRLDIPESIEKNADRVSYRWNTDLREWWVNDPKGVEQGFTLQSRPAGSGPEQPLTLAMTLDSDLVARLGDGGLKLASRDGTTRIDYGKLQVSDADGKAIAARMALTGTSLALRIDDSQAHYPLTIDPAFAQQAYLKASNTDGSDEFGYSVAISGDTVVVGAPYEDSNATGVDGNQADNSAGDSGAAYVFVRLGPTWSQQAYLKASNTDAYDLFGFSVAISGDTVVVGAYAEDSNATGVDGNQADNSAANTGAAYVFVRLGPTWSQQAYLKASNTDTDDQYATTVAISGDTVVVGAWGEDSNATGVDGNQADNSAEHGGAAYVFVRSGLTWSQQAYLKASNTDVFDRFGISVAISGDSVVVGAWEASNATGVDGNQADNSALVAGAAYVFVRSGLTWSQQAYLKASNTDSADYFGWSVAISGDTVVVGAFGEASNGAGVDGNQADNSVSLAGAAYVFVRSGLTWSQQAYLKASNTDVFDTFGFSVAISGDTVVVGADSEDSNATGVDGNQANNSAQNAGVAYVFVRSGLTWSQQAYLKASNTDWSDRFGTSVAISGDTVVVGALEEDSNATGVDGNQADNSASAAGAVYVFKQTTTATFTIGGTVSGLAGTGLDLRINGGDNLAISTNGTFSFPTPFPDGSSYHVAVQSQPGNPSQTCTAGNGSGTLAGANVTDIAVNCVTNTYTIGGAVSGLAGSGLVLRNNGGDDLVISANGAFSFSTRLTDGSTYDVAVRTQPGNLSQTCTAGNGSGTLAGANISNVIVNCVTNRYSIGGTVSGLLGSGLVLQNNASDDRALATNGPFAFATKLRDGSAYLVTVRTQPENPPQTCTLGNRSGTLAGANVTDIAVNCTATTLRLLTSDLNFGAAILGYAGTSTLTLTNVAPQNATAGTFGKPEDSHAANVSDLVITSISNPATPFSLGGGTCLPLPHTLALAQSCTLELGFNPSTEGHFTAQFQIVSNSPSSPDTVYLTGDGVPYAIPVPTLNQAGLMVLVLLILLATAWRARPNWGV